MAWWIDPRQQSVDVELGPDEASTSIGAATQPVERPDEAIHVLAIDSGSDEPFFPPQIKQ